MTGPVLDPLSGLPIGALVAGAPWPRPTRVTLAGRTVRLEPLVAARHGHTLYEETHAPGQHQRWQYLFEAPFADRDAFLQYLAGRESLADPITYAIVRLADGRAVGCASLMRITPEHGCIEVGSIVYGVSLARTVEATEAQYLLMRHVFEDLGYRRYEWKCNALNAPSRAAALRLGFSFEGIFRQHMIIRGRTRDTAWYSVVDHEWPARRAAFEAWLAPANFGADGRQRAALGPMPAREPLADAVN